MKIEGMTLDELIAHLLEFKRDNSVETGEIIILMEGCDCFGGISHIELDRGDLILRRNP